MSVVVVVIGVGVCTVTDVKVNAKGFLCACIAVVSTSLQQIVSNFHLLRIRKTIASFLYANLQIVYPNKTMEGLILKLFGSL